MKSVHAGFPLKLQKDTAIKKTTKPKAINNSAPNQAQIDSLKKVKTKNKTKK